MYSENKSFMQRPVTNKPTLAYAKSCSLEVGFPIRKFTDQSLFAAPHDLSQRTTSFIASQRQGIHRIPLRHLIALIIDAHRSARKACTPFWTTSQRARSYKDQFASNTSEDGAVMLRPLTVALA